MRPLYLTGLGASFLLIAAAFGCSSPTNGMLEPGGDVPVDSPGSGGGSSTAESASGNGGGGSQGGGSQGGTTTSKDAGATGTTSNDAAAPVHDGGADAAPASTCINAVTSPGSGHHNPGQDCASCHDNLGASIRWTVSGTLYNAATGGAAVSGATIEVIDANGQKLDLPTADNGNFYTTTAVAFPLTVRATKCPADLHMTATTAKGSCNTSGCHTSAMRVHIP